MKKLFLSGIAALLLATGTAHAEMVPAICFVEITNQNADKLMKLCGDLSDCFDRPGECEAIERDRRAHVKAGRLVCDNKENCKLVRRGRAHAVPTTRECGEQESRKGSARQIRALYARQPNVARLL